MPGLGGLVVFAGLFFYFYFYFLEDNIKVLLVVVILKIIMIIMFYLLPLMTRALLLYPCLSAFRRKVST